jgi:hypothetical protein
MPRRYDVSLGGVMGRYGECARVRRRHQWVDRLPGAAAMYGRLRALAQRLGEGTRLAYFSVLAVEAGALAQEFHSDNADAKGAYWTVLMPLTTHDPRQGGTEFAGVGLPPHGRAYRFDGSVLHRGTANASDSVRYVLMCVLCDAFDANRSAFDVSMGQKEAGN